MSAIVAIAAVSLFGLLFAAMAIAPALIESAASPPPPTKPRLVVVAPSPSGTGDDERPRAA